MGRRSSRRALSLEACLPLATLLLAAGTSPARAQSTTWYPSASGASVLAFEDQWPGATDYDYNDVVLSVHWTFDRDTSRQTPFGHPVLRAVLTLDPVALGGEHSSGLGLQLPACVSKDGLTVRRRLGTGGTASQAPTYGEWQTLSLRPDAAPTVALSGNLRELFGGEAGRLNVGVAGKDNLSGQRLEVMLEWPVAVELDVGLAPFDLFIFRASNPSHEIHFPGHAGTNAMDVTLFPSGNVGGKRFVNDRGIPAALNLKTAFVYPTEAVRIEAVFPDIVAFAALPEFDAWTGTGLDPRRFYERAGGAGGRRERPAQPLRVGGPVIALLDCTDGLAAGRPGKRVREGTACVFAGPGAGQHAEGGVCVANVRTCSPSNAPANSGSELWSGSAWGACVATACDAGFALQAGACVTTAAALGFVRIPPVGVPGTFTTGTGFLGDGTPDETVTLTRAFWMKSTELTQGEWKARSGGVNPSCFKSAGSTTQTCGPGVGANSGQGDNDSAPVEYVSWYAALGYLNALSVSQGLAECYDLSALSCASGTSWQAGTLDCSVITGGTRSFPNVSLRSQPWLVPPRVPTSVYECEGYRLPTEAEWEFAARAGNATDTYAGNLPTQRAWPNHWDNHLLSGQPAGTSPVGGTSYASITSLGQIAWFVGNTPTRTRPVGQRVENQFGLFDMLGNVSEWNWDKWQNTITMLVAQDPQGGGTVTHQRVFRGGAWVSSELHLALSYRIASLQPHERSISIGFRPARSVNP
jgi:LruC domain-containing protein